MAFYRHSPAFSGSVCQKWLDIETLGEELGFKIPFVKGVPWEVTLSNEFFSEKSEVVPTE